MKNLYLLSCAGFAAAAIAAHLVAAPRESAADTSPPSTPNHFAPVPGNSNILQLPTRVIHLPPLPGQTNGAVLIQGGNIDAADAINYLTNGRPKPTNFPAFHLTWDAQPPLVNNAIATYEVIDGHVSGIPTMTNFFPASNNMVTLAIPNAAAPYWFVVLLIDSNGLTCAPGGLYYNVHSNGQAYLYNGSAYLGWLALTNNTWSVTQVGATNPDLVVIPPSNILESFALPAPFPALWELTRQTNP